MADTQALLAIHMSSFRSIDNLDQKGRKQASQLTHTLMLVAKKDMRIPTVPAQKLPSGCIIQSMLRGWKVLDAQKSLAAAWVSPQQRAITSHVPLVLQEQCIDSWHQATSRLVQTVTVSPCQNSAEMVRIHIIVLREIWQGPSVPQRHWDCWHQPKGSHRQTNWASFKCKNQLQHGHDGWLCWYSLHNYCAELCCPKNLMAIP